MKFPGVNLRVTAEILQDLGRAYPSRFTPEVLVEIKRATTGYHLSDKRLVAIGLAMEIGRLSASDLAPILDPVADHESIKALIYRCREALALHRAGRLKRRKWPRQLKGSRRVLKLNAEEILAKLAVYSSVFPQNVIETLRADVDLVESKQVNQLLLALAARHAGVGAVAMRAMVAPGEPRNFLVRHLRLGRWALARRERSTPPPPASTVDADRSGNLRTNRSNSDVSNPGLERQRVGESDRSGLPGGPRLDRCELPESARRESSRILSDCVDDHFEGLDVTAHESADQGLDSDQGDALSFGSRPVASTPDRPSE
jgi:hypothetical protein